MMLRHRTFSLWGSGRSASACGGLTAGALFLSILFPGCQAGYLCRQAFGALRIIGGRAAIDDGLKKGLDPLKREKIEWIAWVREFSSQELGLDPGDSYTTYYDTKGAPISTIVVAAPPFRLVPYLWRFPLVGSVPYKGFFDPAEAAGELRMLQREGWDAACLPVSAFSALGWISDPVLSTMLELPQGELADLLIHEITHRTVFFPDRADLNEGLATAVAREGARRLLRDAFGDCSPQMREYLEENARDDARQEILSRLRRDLEDLYRSRLSREEKLEHKAALFARGSRELRAAGLRPFSRPSNALLALDLEYRELVPFFEEAMAALGGGPRQLIACLKELRGARDPLAELRGRVAAARAKDFAAGGTSEDRCEPSPR